MNLKIDTLGKKIGFGYTLMTIVLAAAVIITIQQVGEVSNIADRLINLRVPSARASLEVVNGINHSVAALRGYIVLNEKKFKDEREAAWTEEIYPPLAEMETFSPALKDTGFSKRLINLKIIINKLENLQEEAEQLSVLNPEQCRQLMDNSITPLVFQIRDSIKAINNDQEILKQADFANIEQQIGLLNNIEWLLLAAGLLISILLAWLITRSITGPVANAVVVADNIAAGNLDTHVNVGGSKEVEILGNALIGMRDSLKAKTIETERYSWLSTGQNKLNEVMRGDKGIEVLANDIINFMAKYTGSSIGAIFLADDSRAKLHLTGRYAFSNGQTQGKFKMGEGLIGQAAADKQPLALTEVDEKHLRVKSSVVDALPKNIFVSPFLFEDQVLGVLELGKFATFDEMHREFVESNMGSIGIAINSAIARRKIQDLLEETQRQSEELQQQQEDLEQTNEELEEQTQKLKEQQEELQAINEELEEQTQVVEQKNRDLEAARTDIELKAKQLEISSKYKSEFLANMSHELRTPLNSLLILANDLADNKTGNLDEDQVESAQVISKSGHGLLNLINEILDLSKIEAGKMVLNINDVSIQEIADDISRNFRRSAEDKGLKLEILIADFLPETIRTDKQRLEQIIKNFLSNAIKFTEKGNIRVTFQHDAGNNLAIIVKDTGIGIPKGKQGVIFEAFQQAEGGTTRKYGGTGLGLSISRELAKLLSGRITLESKEGKGAAFTLIIPLEKVDEQLNIEKPQPEPGWKKKNIATNSSPFVNYPTIEDQRNEITEDDHSILIIEDDSNFARVLAIQASNKGFKYIIAATGEDGLILAARYQPSAIILDLDLPGIDGHIVLKELKGNPHLRHIPVHIISVYEKTLDPIKSGAVEYLTKPVTKDQLEIAFARIEDFINRKMKNLLIIEDDNTLRKSIVKLIGNGDVQCFEAGSANEAIQIFKQQPIDCMVLDIGLPDMSGFELIKMLEKQNGGKVPPIIVYTGKELSKKENEELQQYAETIIVKGLKSEERLLDETALFLHRTVKDLPQSQQEMITGLYDKEALFQGKKILLVDDDMRNIFALSKVLKEKGFDIIKAENGIMALEALDQNPDIHLVLMDIMMPEMDGYECIQEIRKHKIFKDMPVIALTAKAMKEDRRKCIDAGANDYIAKPVDIERLLSLMRIWIKK